MKKYFILFLFFITLTLTGCNSVKKDQYEKIQERGYIIVGLDDTFAPMGFRDTNNDIVGFDVDLAKTVALKLGLNVRFQPIDWSMKESELNNGNIDFIWNGYTITEEREKLVTFSPAYLENRQVIVTLANSTITTKEQLANKEVAVQSASSSLKAVEKYPNLVENFKNGEPTLYETNDLALRDLEAGRVDAVVVDEILARYYIAKNGVSKYKVLEDNFGTEEYGVGMRKSDLQLIEAFNKAFNEIKQDGTAKKISEKWFGQNIIK